MCFCLFTTLFKKLVGIKIRHVVVSFAFLINYNFFSVPQLWGIFFVPELQSFYFFAHTKFQRNYWYKYDKFNAVGNSIVHSECIPNVYTRRNNTFKLADLLCTYHILYFFSIKKLRSSNINIFCALASKVLTSLK